MQSRRSGQSSMSSESERRSVAPGKSKSGEHEAVKRYREKLESIADNTGTAADELNRTLEEYLQGVKSEPPPPSEAHG